MINLNQNSKTLGRHLLLELYDCNSELLNHIKNIEEILIDAAKIVHATIIETSFHHFSPYGVSGVVVIAESHLTIHTWPEYNYAALDIFTCDETMNIDKVVDFLCEKFSANKFEKKLIKRGLIKSKLDKASIID